MTTWSCLLRAEKLGPSEQDIAAYLIIREVELMMAVDYHDKKLPAI